MAASPDLTPSGWMGSPPRGASMGRRGSPVLASTTVAGKVSLRRVRINSGGYDSGGAYWGLGQPLYWAGSDCGAVDLFFRAPGRDAAKAHVLGRFPNVWFYR